MNQSNQKTDAENQPEKKDLDQLASETGKTGIVGEFVYFLKTNKRWWLTPIILVLLLVGVVVFLSGTVAAPFIYTFW